MVFTVYRSLIVISHIWQLSHPYHTYYKVITLLCCCWILLLRAETKTNKHKLQVYKKRLLCGRLINPACVSCLQSHKSQSIAERSLFFTVVAMITSEGRVWFATLFALFLIPFQQILFLSSPDVKWIQKTSKNIERFSLKNIFHWDGKTVGKWGWQQYFITLSRKPPPPLRENFLWQPSTIHFTHCRLPCYLTRQAKFSFHNNEKGVASVM